MYNLLIKLHVSGTPKFELIEDLCELETEQGEINQVCEPQRQETNSLGSSED